MPGLDFLDEELHALANNGLMRSLRLLEGAQGPRIRLNGREVVNFSSNDYLGLASSQELVAAACAEARRAGAGAGASRLIAGNQVVHERLEGALAAWQGAEAALLFNSGYQANLGVLTALTGPGDIILSDALNHASLIDGCRLSRADVAVYRHADAGHADEILRAHGAASRRRFIVTDAVFSMDGDVAPLAGLREVASAHDAALIVDEAHAVGVLGRAGRGLAAARGVDDIEVHVGTMGKAFGSFGAYVSGAEMLRKVLLNRARSFIFTTALPPGVVGASLAALALLRDERGEERRRQLWRHVARVREALSEMDLLSPGAGESPIFPILVGEEGAAMSCCEALLDRGVYVQGIRPPTVPRGTSRLRLALMASHRPDDVERVLEGLGALRDQGKLRPVPPGTPRR